jgi:hypothetical protein
VKSHRTSARFATPSPLVSKSPSAPNRPGIETRSTNRTPVDVSVNAADRRIAAAASRIVIDSETSRPHSQRSPLTSQGRRAGGSLPVSATGAAFATRSTKQRRWVQRGPTELRSATSGRKLGSVGA